MSAPAHKDRGRLVFLELASEVLAGNALGDPAVRQFPVWLPPQYDDSSTQRFPVLFDLVGYTGSGWSHVNWRAFDESVPQQAARLIAEGRMGPVIIVFPDCFTSLGGNQYINSEALGNYADYLTSELVPFIDSELRTLPHRRHRACFGKSSGGYGSLIHGMKYPDTWGAIACHSGDCDFDMVYRTGWPLALAKLSAFRDPAHQEGPYSGPAGQEPLAVGEDDGRVWRFLKHIDESRNPDHDEVMTLMMLAMAASYDPAPDAPNGFRLPYNLETGEILEQRWKAWLEHDPIHMIDPHRDELKSLRGIFIDCGWRDQYFIQFGSRQLSAKLSEAGVEHVYQEFDDDHSNIDYRMDHSLPFLYEAIKP